MVFPRTVVWFTAGPTTYELDIHLSASLFEPVRQRAALAGSETVGRVSLTPDQHLLLVGLCEPVLRRNGRGGAATPTSSAVAARLGWTATKFNRKLDNVCEKLAKLGVRGLHGDASRLATSRKARLVEHALATQLVTEADLDLLPPSPEDARVTPGVAWGVLPIPLRRGDALASFGSSGTPLGGLVASTAARGAPGDRCPASLCPRPRPVGRGRIGAVNGSGARTAFGGGRRTTLALLTVLVVLTVASGVVWWNVLEPGSATPAAAGPPATSPVPTTSPAPTPSPSDGTSTEAPEDDLPRAAVPLADDQIVWRHNVGTDWAMSTISPGGARSRVVLASGEQEVAPLVSHDRRTVLYLRRERPGDRSSLHAVAADGSVQRLLFRDGTTSCPYLRQVAWSVDGTLALVCKIDERGTSYTLSTARTDGTVVRTLDVGLIGGPTFSPDGRDLLYPKASSGSYKRGGPLYRTAVDGSTEPEKVVGGRNVTPAWAPRGTTIAFSRYSDDERPRGHDAGRRRCRRHRGPHAGRHARPRPHLVAGRRLARLPARPGRRQLPARGDDERGEGGAGPVARRHRRRTQLDAPLTTPRSSRARPPDRPSPGHG